MRERTLNYLRIFSGYLVKISEVNGGESANCLNQHCLWPNKKGHWHSQRKQQLKIEKAFIMHNINGLLLEEEKIEPP